MAESNADPTQNSSLESLPPDEEVNFKEVHPKFPVLSQEGNHYVLGKNGNLKSMAEAAVYLRFQRKKKAHLETKGELSIIRRGFGGNGRSGLHENASGLDQVMRWKLAEGDKGLDEVKRENDQGDDCERSSENGDSKSNGSSSSIEFCTLASSTEVEVEGQEALKEVKVNKEQSTKPDISKTLTTQSQRFTTEKKKLPGKMYPADAWQDTDMLYLQDNLPSLQSSAESWILKFEEIMAGKNPSMGVIKCLLFNLIGLQCMETILRKAGLFQYLGSYVNDLDPFDLHKDQVWKELRNRFPSDTTHVDVVIRPLGAREDPMAYVSRAYKSWTLVTKSRPKKNEMEVAILRSKIEEGLPPSVRSRLAGVVGLEKMGYVLYKSHIAREVEQYRKKMRREKSLEKTLRRFENLRLETKQPFPFPGPPLSYQHPPQLPPGQIQVPQHHSSHPMAFRPNPGSGYPPKQRRGGQGTIVHPNCQKATDGCWACGKKGHFSRECWQLGHEPRINQNLLRNKKEFCFLCGSPGHWARDCVQGMQKN